MQTDDRYKQALEKSADAKSDIERLYETPALAVQRTIDRLDAQQQSFDALDQRVAGISSLIDRGHALLARTNKWIATAKKAVGNRT